MRRRIIIIILSAVLLALLGAAGHFLLGWWQPSHPVTPDTSGEHVKDGESATLAEVLANAREALAAMDRDVHDYSGTVIKQELIGDTLVEKKMRVKVREKPFSVYLYFLDVSNEDAKGREVIYVEGKNGNKLLVHSPGLLTGAFILPLPPKGLLAMKGEHYPITEFGLANLCRQLIQRGEGAGDPSQVQVKRFHNARIGDRPCTLLEVTYPVREKNYRGYFARVFVDDEWHFPTCVKVYGLPVEANREPQLVEAYTYLDLKFNNGYTDADFDPKNPQYNFPK